MPENVDKLVCCNKLKYRKNFYEEQNQKKQMVVFGPIKIDGRLFGIIYHSSH